MPATVNARPIASHRVDLGTRSYDVIIGPDLLGQAGSYISPLLPRPRTVIVTDETVGALHQPRLAAALSAAGIDHETITLPAGESTKSFAHLERLCEDLLSAGVERDDAIIALGGGVIGDITGFAAAILRRGCRFIQIPTTLLAQVDSSVGGKTAINARQGKNLIGAFHQPVLVLADIDVLSTLPRRQLLAGYAEVVKYGLLGDADFFNWLEAHGPDLIEGDADLRSQAVLRSVAAKAQIVAADEREKGQRALLNLGHTFGHALEAETGYTDRLFHGEGVAIGCQMAFDFSQSLGHASGQDAERVRAHFRAVGLPTRPLDIDGLATDAATLLAHMYQDKKVSDGKLTLILTRAIGDAFVARDVDPARVEAFLSATLTRT